jgi:hypothetical protein
VTVVSFVSVSCTAKADQGSIRDAQLRFVKSYTSAIASKDLQKIEQTFHPAYRTCVTPDSHPFFETVFARKMRDQPATGYKVTSITPVDAKAPSISAAFLPPDAFSYPVNPTHTIQIEFEPTNGGSSFYSAMIEIAPDHGDWYWVGPCPNAKGMALFQQSQQAAARDKAEAEKLASALKDPLLAELKALLRDGHRATAINKYSTETGSDTTTAVHVIDALTSSASR